MWFCIFDAEARQKVALPVKFYNKNVNNAVTIIDSSKNSVPMDKKSTHLIKSRGEDDCRQDSPSKLTLAFIKQFARTYTFESRLPEPISAIYPN